MVTSRKRPPFQAINHTADFGFDVFGKTRKELFSHGATAMFSLMTRLQSVEIREERSVTVDGTDLDDLWINYLRELLYLYNGMSFLVREIHILKIGKKHMIFLAKGESFDPTRHEILTEIKAVTYHQAVVKRTIAGWRGRFIVDV